MNEPKPSPLAQLRMRLKYQAVAMTCSLGPKDCAEMLALVEEADLQLTAALLPKSIEPGRHPFITTQEGGTHGSR